MSNNLQKIKITVDKSHLFTLGEQYSEALSAGNSFDEKTTHHRAGSV